MMETPFGSASPMWTAIPSPGFSFQAPMTFATRSLSVPAYGSSTVSAIPGVPAGGLPTAGPVLAPDMVGAITASGLLNAVAMRRGQPQGPTNDQEVEDFICDALDLLPGAAEVEVRCEGGRVTLSGSVQHKRVKHDAGEIAWTIPGLQDVQNNVTITPRRRVRAAHREDVAPNVQATRKQS